MTTRGTGQNPRPGEQDDEYPGFLWPHDEQDDGEAEEGRRTAPVRAPVPPDGRVPWQWPVPPAVTAVPRPKERRRRILALAITAIVAVGAGAGAMLLYRSTQGGAALAAEPRPVSDNRPARAGARPGLAEAGS